MPNVVFKVPTGGGKTYLAVLALAGIFGRYLGRSTGFVLWIAPNEAIYSPTRRHLADRQHPYRQMLDVIPGNRLRLMEKGDKLDARDVDANLCLMLLMLQAANRESKETLYGFNPCFVLELTATPKDVAARGGKNPRPARPANVLVEVAGLDLDREGMIKMPLNLEPRAGSDWREALRAALERLDDLEVQARRFHGDSGRSIRPILLVQVERTGAEQRNGALIHALDAKDWLIAAGLNAAEIAIKTADTNDLANPENQDLLAPPNRVRAIITKQALQEGWDCPFAYVLCSLAASHNASALTQLVCRILRQPQAQKTGVAALDECYVVTHRAETARVVAAIKQGLEEDGLGDLAREIRLPDPDCEGGGGGRGPRTIPRRPAFAKTAIYLPRVLRVEEGAVRELDYEQDILFALDWSGIDLAPLAGKIPKDFASAERQMRRIRLTEAARNASSRKWPTGQGSG